jgi:hypothetical protein
MAFVSDITWIEEKNPHRGGGGRWSGRIFEIGGTFTNGAGDTGGVIDLTGSFNDPIVIYADAVDESAANAVRVQRNTPARGKITLTTAIGDDGSWKARIKIK